MGEEDKFAPFNFGDDMFGKSEKNDEPAAPEEEQYAHFQFPTAPKSIIKVIGVGGGGSNAVNHMYDAGIHDVSFVVCNTDKKALFDSRVPTKLQLGSEGLGAGNNPSKARQATEESMEEVKALFDDGTKMTFITAGMGGGTGTGAAPLIAKVSKDMGVLTIGIVTIPFRWEGNAKIDQALDGVEEMSKNVDALLVVNNERLREIYQDKSLYEGFDRADDTLCNAAKSISEIITMHGRINLDFNDVRTVLKDGGVAIMSTGYGAGDGRVTKAIESALTSPLLNDNDIYHSKKVLIHIVEPGPQGEAPLMMDEVNDINEFMERMQNTNLETKWGHSFDPELKDKVKVTILASGFGMKDINMDEMDERIEQRNEEQRKRDAEEEARRIERDQRRLQYYQTGKANLHKPVYPYIFSAEDLDNDDIISSVESSPTGKRQKKTLSNLVHAAERAESAPQEGEVIAFG